jgi:hypothetical protein
MTAQEMLQEAGALRQRAGEPGLIAERARMIIRAEALEVAAMVRNEMDRAGKKSSSPRFD